MYKFIFYRFTIYLCKITYIFVNFLVAILIKFGNFWVVILRKRQFLGFNSSKSREFWLTIRAKVGNFFFLPPLWRHSIFLEYLWCREYGGIRSLRTKFPRGLTVVNFRKDVDLSNDKTRLMVLLSNLESSEQQPEPGIPSDGLIFMFGFSATCLQIDKNCSVRAKDGRGSGEGVL